MTTTQSQAINALAYVMTHVRPEWDTPGCVAALRRAPDVPFAELAIAAIRCASDPRNDTPAALTFIDNAAWDSDRAWACTKHPHAGRRTNGECAGCWTDRIEADLEARREHHRAQIREEEAIASRVPEPARTEVLAALAASIRNRQVEAARREQETPADA